MIASQAGLFIEREIGLALRARWFLGYVAVFMAGGLLFSMLGLGDSAVYGYRGFARAITGLVQLSLLFLPVMALLPAVAAIADERETGGLEYLLSQPVNHADVFLGKWLGVSVAMILAITVGFGAAAGVALWRGVPVGLLVTLWSFLILLALVFVSLGLCLAAVVASRGRAGTLGTGVWLLCVAFGTLGVMAAFIRWGVPADVLVTWTFLNPVEAFRLGIVSVLDPDMSLLGPVGSKIAGAIGSSGTTVATAGSLAVWSVVLVALGWWRFGRGR